MPKAVARTEPGRIANNREALSSATQLSAFGVRLAKFTYRFSADGAADFLSNYDIPAASRIKSVSVYSAAGVTGATNVDVQAGGVDIVTLADFSVAGAQALTVASEIQSGEIGLVFNAAPTAGECTVAVEYIDISEIR
jgi:hypothetical protein